MQKFFKFVHHVNALAFFAGVVLALGLLLWMIGSSLWDNKVKTSVVVPNASEESSPVLSLSAWEFIPEIGVQVLKLQSTGGEPNDYASEGRGYKTRNLLFVKADGGGSGSMHGEPLDEAMKCVSHIAKHLTPKDDLSIVVYDSQVDVLMPIGPMLSQDAVQAAISQVTSGGSTNLHGG